MEAIALSYDDARDPRRVIAMAERLCLPQSIDRHLGTHGLHRGLSNGWLATTWLACIIATGDCRKSKVKEWVDQYQHLLEPLLQRSIRPVEFSDGRLGILLHRLSDVVAWRGVEGDLWDHSPPVPAAELTGVRVYSTTLYGPGTPAGEGAARPRQEGGTAPESGSPSVHVAIAVLEPGAHVIASELFPAQLPANPCGAVLISRVRDLLEGRRLLYYGDAALAEGEIRARIVRDSDHYVVGLPGSAGASPGDPCLQRAIDGQQPSQVIEVGGSVVGAGCEIERLLTFRVGDEPVEWLERVQVVRSLAGAHRLTSDLAQRLKQAETALRGLAGSSGQGKRFFKDEVSLRQAVARVLSECGVEGLLHVTWRRQERKITSYVGRGRGGPNRPRRTLTQTRYAITHIWRDQDAVEQQARRLGWHVQATSLPPSSMGPHAALVRCYTESLRATGPALPEFPFLRAGPLHLRRDDQTMGLACLLILSCRLHALLRAWAQGAGEEQGSLATAERR